ncbi:MAG TPA: hypothetical protein VKQ11_22670 [Candidatus Sulfotelmatobacter sp.]|nr:hypothetical protein [Candidatus Sulfotelmatobacter sp.]
MNSTGARFARVGGALLLLVTVGWFFTLHAARPYEHGLPTDWSHRHIIFSQPRTAEQVARVAHDTRYWQQFVRRKMVRLLSVEDGISNPDQPTSFATAENSAGPSSKGLWAINMGTGATVGAGNYPTKYGFSVTTATCSNSATPDFVIFNTGLQASTSQASIIAYDNLYSGCSAFGTVPSVYWAYNTTIPPSTHGTVKTSPITSLDGSQVAFVQTDGTNGYVILLKWKAGNGTLTSPIPPAIKTAANYPGCTAPCMTAFQLRTTATGGTQTNDITSSIFYDYSGDTAYIGDSTGLLHKYHPFFTTGAPAEVGSPWPIKANVANPKALTSAVYDHVTGNVFVGDSGGYFARVNAGTGAATVSARVDYGVGISTDGPILDQTAQKLYVFSSSDGTTNCAGAPCSAVFQFSTTFLAGTSGTETQVGTSSATPNFLYAGDFDDAYYSSSNQTGNLYVCGNTGSNPIMYHVPISAGVMPAVGTSLNTVTTTGTSVPCSSVTDVSNPNAAGGLEERIYFSPQNHGRATLCASKGCVESFIVTPWQASTAYSLGHELLSPNDHTEVAIVAGTSAATEPAWGTTTGAILVDGGVTWIDQGHLTAIPLAGWTANTAYAFGARIIDSNGKVEVVNTAGTSGGATPGWSTTVGAKTTDGTVKWINASMLPVSALQTAGGASGIIMDNVVSSGTMAGASQVYFSTLTGQACTSGGSGGCAVQASQAGLQ